MKTTITGLTEQEVKQKQEAGQGQGTPQYKNNYTDIQRKYFYTI